MISEVKVSLQKAEPESISEEGGSCNVEEPRMKTAPSGNTKGDKVMTSLVKAHSRKRNLRGNKERLSAAMSKNRKRELHKVIVLR